LSSPQLSPIATYEGQIVGRNIVEGPKHKPDYASIPSCVYTVPALASVGLTEAKAKELGHKTKIHSNDMRDWLSSRTYNEAVAWAKVIVDEATDRILGAHMVGHAGEEPHPYLCVRDEVRHHGRPDAGYGLRLPDLFSRHQSML